MNVNAKVIKNTAPPPPSRWTQVMENLRLREQMEREAIRRANPSGPQLGGGE